VRQIWRLGRGCENAGCGVGAHHVFNVIVSTRPGSLILPAGLGAHNHLRCPSNPTTHLHPLQYYRVPQPRTTSGVHISACVFGLTRHVAGAGWQPSLLTDRIMVMSHDHQSLCSRMWSGRPSQGFQDSKAQRVATLEMAASFVGMAVCSNSCPKPRAHSLCPRQHLCDALMPHASCPCRQ